MYRNSIRNYQIVKYCKVCFLACLSLSGGLSAQAQAPTDSSSFEVATVKPVVMDASHPFSPKHFGAHVSPSGASYWSMTVGYLIGYAYGVDFIQVIGPKWISTDRFDIEARFPTEAVKQDDRRMLQTLLKDRFNLAFHVEKRELESYALVADQHGLKLRPSLPDPETPQTDASSKPLDGKVGEGSAKPAMSGNSERASDVEKRGTQTVTFDQEHDSQHWELSKMMMDELAKRLSVCIDSTYHKVVDETGAKGFYQVAYDCPVPRPQRPVATGVPGALPPDPQDGYILARSLNLLGLKLEKRKLPMDFYVIDHIDKPSKN